MGANMIQFLGAMLGTMLVIATVGIFIAGGVYIISLLALKTKQVWEQL